MRTARKTLAVLIDYMTLFGAGYELEMRTAFERACHRLDLNLFFVYGRSVAPQTPGLAAHNKIYELLGPSRIDGLVVLANSLFLGCEAEAIRLFFDRYRGIALCSAGLSVPSVPSLEVDNRAGLEVLIEHLISDHGHRRLAFIGGPPENVDTQSRFEVYREVLERHGLALDPALVEDGGFMRRLGHLAMQRILVRAGKPDAVVAASDAMALGAIGALREAGFRVPRDLAVTGFDDLLMARLGAPPLTTVSQPIATIAETAVELVARQLAGSSVPERTVLTTRFVPRKSCGCNGATRTRSRPNTPLLTASKPSPAPSSLQTPTSWPTAGAPETADSDDDNDSGSDWARLSAALHRELQGSTEALSTELENLLAEGEATTEHFESLQATITRLRHELGEANKPELEDLWDEARSLIALTNARHQEQLRLDQDEAYHRLLENSERLGTALDLPSLRVALTSALPLLGMDHVYISRHSQAEAGEIEAVVCIKDGVPHLPPNPSFPAQELFPVGCPQDRRVTFLIFPLVYDTENMGVAVFEARPGFGGHQVVRDQISTALRSLALHREIIEQTTLHERRIQEQERQATAKRIQSLSVLAGGVAHDLNNVLGPLVALPDLILEELDRPLDCSRPVPPEIRTDLETIKTSALRATQTIKDLLTLGRQGRTAKEPLDLNEAVYRSLTSDPSRLRHASTKVSLSLSAERLFVLGSEAHLSRAVLNLVRNALEALEGEGHVLVETRATEVAEPIKGYETVEPGSYALIVVSDNGRGIPAHDIGRVFEPFFSSKRLSDDSGSGLGLSIVHGVVKEHGGFVNVESAVGCGTTFTLYLPRTNERRRMLPTLAEVPYGAAKILVIDDEPVQLRTCRRVLSPLGYQVDTLSSGHQAYQLFLKLKSGTENDREEGTGPSPYDLLIVDMILNEEDDGLVLFGKIRDLFPDLKGIVASGHAPSKRIELAVAHGLTWLAKPYTRTTLARAVHSALMQ